MQVCMGGVCVLPNQQGRRSIRVVATNFLKHGSMGAEASKAELEGSIDCGCLYLQLELIWLVEAAGDYGVRCSA